MAVLVACLSSGKGTWGHVIRLIEGQEWDKVILITNDFGKQNFKCQKDVELVVFDMQKPVKELIKDIVKELRNKLGFGDVALNLVSGSGKEHMAIFSALIKLGVGIRLIALTRDGVGEI